MEALTYLREEILVLMARTEDGEARVQEGREAGMMGDMEGMLDGQVVEDVEAVVVVVVEEEVETGAGLGEEMVEVEGMGEVVVVAGEEVVEVEGIVEVVVIVEVEVVGVEEEGVVGASCGSCQVFF